MHIPISAVVRPSWNADSTVAIAAPELRYGPSSTRRTVPNWRSVSALRQSNSGPLPASEHLIEQEHTVEHRIANEGPRDHRGRSIRASHVDVSPTRNRSVPTDEASPAPPCVSIRLDRTKTTTSDDDEHVLLICRPAIALKRWLMEGRNQQGGGVPHLPNEANIDRRALPAA